MGNGAGGSAITGLVEDWCVDGLQRGAPWMVDDDPLSDLTVIIPTWSRQDYVLRQFLFWSTSAVRLIVVDGSDTPLTDRVRSMVSDHPRFTYLHDPRSFAERLRYVGENLSTKYAVMLGDDEFHLPSGLRSAIRILDYEEDLVGCMGQVLSFSPLDGYRRCLFSRAYPGMANFSVRHEEPNERVLAAMDPYTMATCYAVLRTPVWQQSWGSVGGYSSGVAAEMQQAIAVHLLGPFRSHDAVQWLRSVENSINPVSDLESERGRMLWFPEWWESDDFQAEHQEFLERITTAVAENSPCTPAECRGIVSAGACLFAERHGAAFKSLDQIGGVERWRHLPLTRLALSVAGRLPDGVGLALRRFRSLLHRRSGAQGDGYLGVVEELPRRLQAVGLESTVEFLAEVALVEQLVAEFHSLRGERPT
jgi:glycosyltransferase domain-containing protein